MSTITDVCKLAGVSKATVSRVLNGTGQVKESTRELVYAAMEELDYRPNSMARALATNQSMTIGFILSHFEGDYFDIILQEAADTTKELGYQLLISGGFDSAEKELEAIRMLSDRCDAIVMYTRFMSGDMLHQVKQILNIPLVLFNREDPQFLFPCVLFEQQQAVVDIADYIISNGHRKIACITGLQELSTTSERLLGYQQALRKHGIDYQSKLVETGDYTISSGYKACKRLIATGIPFTAILSCNDSMAFGALKALHEANIQVPEEVCITGIDDAPMAEYVQPALTSMRQPTIEMTQKAISLAVELAKEKVLDCTDEFYFPGTLITRDSVIGIN